MGTSMKATMSWPMVKPMTICMYENESAATDPGTEMKVTPDIAAPIIASVAAYHDVRLPPMKKVALSAPSALRRASRKRSTRYAASVMRIASGDIFYGIWFVTYHNVVFFAAQRYELATKKIAFQNKFNIFAWR